MFPQFTIKAYAPYREGQPGRPGNECKVLFVPERSGAFMAAEIEEGFLFFTATLDIHPTNIGYLLSHLIKKRGGYD
jgi:hypothetical protein